MNDAPPRRPVRAPRRATLAVLAAVLAVCTTPLAFVACARGGDAVDRRRDELVEEALGFVGRRLRVALKRADRALDGVAAAIDRAGPDRARRFSELEELRANAVVDGVYVEDPSGEALWAGEPVEKPELPAPRPWDASFATGGTTFHAGPFLRALVVQRAGTTGGVAQASVVLRDPGGSPLEGTVETRWATRLGVRAVRILPPSALRDPPTEGVRRLGVRGPRDAEDVLTVEVEAPSREVVADRTTAERRRAEGAVGLLGALLLGVAAAASMRRTLRGGAARALAVAGLALALRAVLGLLDLSERFPGLSPATGSRDFGMPGWLGWLSSPLDLLLTAAALLLAAVGVGRALAIARPPRSVAARVATALLGTALAVLASLGWLEVVRAATVHSQIDFFAPGSLLPPMPRAVMLSALVAAAAAAFLAARAGLTLAGRTFPRGRPRVVEALAGLVAAAAALAAAPAGPAWWAPALCPLAATLAAVFTPTGPRTGPPSRILLVSVVATAMLFPVLWTLVERASRFDVSAEVAALVRQEQEAASGLAADVEWIRDDPYLVEQLDRVAQGAPVPDGLALSVWLRLPFARGGDDAAVVVFDARGARISRFLLNTPPFAVLAPAVAEPTAPDDVGVTVGRDVRGGVRTTIARVRVRRVDGRAVGTVVVLVPDALAVVLSGTSPRLVARSPATDPAEGRLGRRLTLLLAREGEVVAGNAAEIPRRRVPPEVFALEGPRWVDWEGAESGGHAEAWYAHPAGDRGVVLARRDPRDARAGLVALARVSVVGVGIGAVLALLALLGSLAGARSFRPRLQHRILGSYFAVSVLPLVVLAWANWKATAVRSEESFRTEQAQRVRAAREEIEAIGVEEVERYDLPLWAARRRQDVFVYRHGSLMQGSKASLLDAELMPSRLPAAAYRATEIEGRDFYLRAERLAGLEVRVGYAPLRDAAGRTIGTLSVPLVFDSARAEREAAETGSLLFAAYLLTLVLTVVLGIYTARGLARPLDRLAEGAKRVGAGELDVAIEGGGSDEVGTLVESFNRMTAELRDARSKAAAAERERAWRGMARQVAHEIKNPLTPMKLMLQQLQALARADRAAAVDAIEPTARIALEQIDALGRIASDFSAFARFPPRDVRDTDVNAILSSVAALFDGGDGSESVVRADLASGLPPVRWDADELRRVFVNLVANAVQSRDAARAGPVRVAVRSEAAADPATGRAGLRVVVEDDGVGIPPAARGRLFEPDFSTKSGGTGLGLAIVKRILADLAGTIDVDSEPGRGTRVTVWLPAGTPPEGAKPTT